MHHTFLSIAIWVLVCILSLQGEIGVCVCVCGGGGGSGAGRNGMWEWSAEILSTENVLFSSVNSSEISSINITYASQYWAWLPWGRVGGWANHHFVNLSSQEISYGSIS